MPAQVFLDKDDLKDGATGAEYVDVSGAVLCFCTGRYLESRACAREIFRAVLTGKPLITVLEPDEARGGLTREVIEAILLKARYAPHFKKATWFGSGEKSMTWADRWQLDGEVAKWSKEWGYEVVVPTGEQIVTALFALPPIEWNRLSNFQDVTMRLTAERLLPEEARGKVYVQGEAARSLPKALPLTHKRKFHVYASPHHPRAAALCEELAALGIGITYTVEIDQVTPLHMHSLSLTTTSHLPVSLSHLL